MRLVVLIMSPMEFAQVSVSLLSAGIAAGIAVALPIAQIRALRAELSQLQAQCTRANERIDYLLEKVSQYPNGAR